MIWFGDVRLRFAAILTCSLLGASLMTSCTKGTKSAASVRASASNWKATPTELQNTYPPNRTILDPIKFVVTTKEGSPVPNINVEFKAFDVTPAFNGGVSTQVMKAEILTKWSDGNFVMNSAGSIAGNTCDAGFTRDLCVGMLSGPSKVTNQNGEATVGFTTPNAPGGVMAIAMRVPQDSTASELIELVLVKITSNDDFANSGIEPLQSALLAIPMLFDGNGRQVIQAGVPFNLAIYAPGIPNTQPGKGFMFDFVTEGLLEPADGSTVAVPSGSKRCEFRNSQCIVPGGPFRVLKPTTLSFSARPTDPKFPVRPASMSLPVITGQASQLILSLTADTKNIQNACLDAELLNKPCVVTSADTDKVDLYPMLVDAGGNWVESPDTIWSEVTGPLQEPGSLAFQTVTQGKQTLYPKKASGESSTYDTIRVSVKGKNIYMVLRYLIKPGVPKKAVIDNRKQTAAEPFKVLMSLKDRNDNLCYNFSEAIPMKLALSPLSDAVMPPVTGIVSSVTKVGSLNFTNNKVQFLNGVASTGVDDAGKEFLVTRVPPIGDRSQWPRISITEASLSSGFVSFDTESEPLEISPGKVVQTLWRDASGGLGTSWIERAQNPDPKIADPVMGYKMASDQQYNFYLAGYDAAANYAGDFKDVKFWGINYKLEPSNATEFNAALTRLFNKDPSVYGGRSASSQSCPGPSPKTPLAGRPLTGADYDALSADDKLKEDAYGDPTNQPEDNIVYCGIHAGLDSKAGVSAIAFNSVGIPGTGRILAIPNAMYGDNGSIVIKPAITPRLTLVAGAASKFGFEFVSDEDGPDKGKVIYQSYKRGEEDLMPTGHKFKIRVHAMDAEDNDSPAYSGEKTLQVKFTGDRGWAGIYPKLPSGDKVCEFGKTQPGVCDLPDQYMLADSRSAAILVVKQLGSGGIEGTFAKIVQTKTGVEKRIFFANKKGGPKPVDGAVAETTFSSPLGRTIKADSELPLALAITDAGGSYIRDAAASDNIVFDGFRSDDGQFLMPTDPTGALPVFNPDEGVWRNTTPWNESYTNYDVFVADTTAANPTGAKFYNPDYVGPPQQITQSASTDLTRYNTVFVPQNRFGSGFAVPRSLANSNLIGWPSSWWTVTPGDPEHIETRLVRGSSPDQSWVKPGFETADEEQKTNWVSASDTCYDMVITIHDKKHNQLANYTGVVPDVVFKMINATPSKPNGADDLQAGIFAANFKNNVVQHYYYQPHNAVSSPGPFRDGFYLLGAGETDGGLYNFKPAPNLIIPPSLNDWLMARVTVTTGVITTGVKACLYNGQRADNRNDAVPYMEKFIQIDMPSFTAADGKTTFPAFQSRGAGIKFTGPGGQEIGSIASGHTHEDKITVFRAPSHHLHPTFSDSVTTSQWDGSFPGIPPIVGVSDRCPMPKCGKTEVFWHEHDVAHNFIRPARTEGFSTSADLPSGAKVGSPGLMGSPSTVIFDVGDSRFLPLLGDPAVSQFRIYAQNNFIPFIHPGATATGDSYRNGAFLSFFAGPPKTMEVSRLGASTLSVDEPFGLRVALLDEFGNRTGGQNYHNGPVGDQTNNFGIDRTLSVRFDREPSSGPASGQPKLMGRTKSETVSLADSQNPVTRIVSPLPSVIYTNREFGASVSTDNISLVKANESLNLMLTITDSRVIPFCQKNALNCCFDSQATCDAKKDQPRSISAVFPVNAQPGLPTGTVITSGTGTSALQYPAQGVDPADVTAAYTAIFNTNPQAGETYPLGASKTRTIKTYACAKDQFGNIGACDSNAQFAFVGASTPSPVEALSSMLNVPFFSWLASKPGSFSIQASKNGFTAVTAPISVGSRPLAAFKFENITEGTSVAAGSDFQFKVCMIDGADNIIDSQVFGDQGLITDPNAELTVGFSLFGVNANPENRTLALSTAGGNGFEAAELPMTAAQVKFNQGCATLYSRIFAASTYNNVPLLSLTYIDPKQSNKPFSGSGIVLSKVDPVGFDHYATAISKAPVLAGTATVPAFSDPDGPGVNIPATTAGGNRFDLTVYARDVHGNDITYSNDFSIVLQSRFSTTPSTLKLTCANPANDNACLNKPMAGSAVTIPDLAMDIPGTYFVFAKNSDGTGISLENSAILTASANVKTIAEYRIDAPASSDQYNGQLRVRVTALDNKGGPVTGIADQLNQLNFTWVDDAGQLLSSRLPPYGTSGNSRFKSQCVPSFIQPVFDNLGVANGGDGKGILVGLTKTEIVKINIKDSQSPSVVSKNNVGTERLPFGINYDTTCQRMSGGSDCTGTAAAPVQMDASPENRFKLTVTTYDDCGNEQASNNVVYLNGFIGRLEWLPGEANVSAFGTMGYNFNMDGNSQRSFSDLFVRAVGLATYSITDPRISNGAPTSNGTKVYHNYRPTRETVFQYNLKDVSSNSVKTGQPITFKVEALDSANNPISGIDDILGLQQYSWFGGGLAPNGEGPIYPTGANPSTLSFTNGVTGTLSVTFKKAEQIIDFYVMDDFIAGASGVKGYGTGAVPADPTGKRRSLPGGTTFPIVVSEGLPIKFTLSTDSTTVKAGSPFDVKVTVTDKFNNLVTGFGTDTLTFDWTGASASVGAPTNPLTANATARNAGRLDPGVRSFDPGTATFSSTGAPFVLYRSNATSLFPQERPTLKVTGAKTGAQTETGQPLASAPLQFTVQPADEFAYAKVGSASTWDATTDFSGKAFSMSNDQTKVFFGHLFDPWGNYKGTDPLVQWTGSNVLENRLFLSQGLSTTLTPTLAGDGVVRADCSQIAGTCLADNTGTISINPSPLKTWGIELLAPHTAGNSTVNAGDTLPFKLCMLDKNNQVIKNTVTINGQPVTVPNGPVSGIGLSRTTNINTANAEKRTIEISTKTGNDFDSGVLPFDSNTLNFSQGCVNLYAKIYRADTYGPDKPLISFSYSDPNQSFTPIGGTGLFVAKVNPLVHHHYLTWAGETKSFPPNIERWVPAWADPTTQDTYAKNDGNRFVVSIVPVDAYGNSVPITGTVNLRLASKLTPATPLDAQRLKCSGVNNNNDQSCLSVNFSNQDWKQVDKLAVDIPGEFYIQATDSSGKSIVTEHSTLLTAGASAKTIKSYVLSAPASIVAGQAKTVTVQALDAAGNPVLGADPELRGLQFDWLNGTTGSNLLKTTQVSPAPVSAVPDVPDTLNFNAGIANPSIVLTKATDPGALLKINIRDKQASPISSNNQTSTEVRPGLSLNYALSCTKTTGETCTGASGSPVSIDASPADSFSLQLQAFDEYRNPKSDGANSPAVKLTRINTANDAPLVGFLEQSPKTASFDASTQLVIPMTGLVQNSVSSLFHRAGPHVLSFSVDPSSANYTSMVQQVFHSYQAHIDMVYQYDFSPALDAWPSPAIPNTTSMVAGTAQNFTLRALDRAGNIAKGIDPQLKLQKYLWRGPSNAPVGGVSGAPDLPGPMTGAGESLNFSQGEVVGLSVNFKNAETIADFHMIDNYAPGPSGVGGLGSAGKRRSIPRDSANPLKVINGRPTEYILSATSTTVRAGVGFDVFVQAVDQFKNPAKTWTQDYLTFSWQNANSSSTSPGGNPLQADRFPSNSRTFDSETATFATTGSSFKLYKAPETPTLKVTGTTPPAAGIQPLEGNLQFTSQPSTTYGYVKIASSLTYDDTTKLSNVNLSMATNDIKNFFAHMFDPWGNYLGNGPAVRWTGSGQIANKFSPVDAAATTLTANVVGGGIVTASCSSLDAGCLQDSTGTVTVGASPLKDFVVEPAGSIADGATVQAGTEIPMKVCMLDKAGQRITSNVSVDGTIRTYATDPELPVSVYALAVGNSPENKSIAISRKSGTDFEDNKIPIGNPTTLPFSEGCAPFWVKLYAASTYTATDARLQINHTATLQDPDVSVTGSGLRVAQVTPLALDHFAVSADKTSSTPQDNSVFAQATPDNILASNGGSRFDIIVNARDLYGNAVFVPNTTLQIATRAGDKVTQRDRPLVCPQATPNCLTPQINGTSLRIENVAIDVGGFSFYPVASGGGKSTTIFDTTKPVYAVSSPKTVKEYVLTYLTSVTAGVPFNVNVVAKDVTGANVQGSDAALSDLIFSWQDGASPRQLLSTHTAPNAAAPIGAESGKLTFAGGSATRSLTLTKAEANLNINVIDNQSTPVMSTTSTTTQKITVAVGSQTWWDLTCVKFGGASCNGTESNPTVITGPEKYSLTLKSFDEYRNQKFLTASPRLQLTKMALPGGAVSPGSLEQFPMTLVKDYTSHQLTWSMINAHEVTADNFFRRSADTYVSIAVNSTSAPFNGMISTVYHRYQPTLDSVYLYAINGLPTDSAGANYIPIEAGKVYNGITISAIDGSGNPISNIQSDLNLQTYSWEGVGIAAGGQKPVLPGVSAGAEGPSYPASVTFGTNGVAGPYSATFYKAELLKRSEFVFRDNYNGTDGLGGVAASYRWGNTYGQYEVLPAKASSYQVSSATTTPRAGSPFNVNVTAVDDYLNVVKGWTNDDLTFSWGTTAPASLANPKTGSSLPAGYPQGQVAAAFTNGIYNTTDTPFTLYKSNFYATSPQQVSTLTVSGSNIINTKNNAQISGQLSFTTQPAVDISYVQIANSESFSDESNKSGDELNFNNNQILNLYAHMFDAYGNYKNRTTNVDWSGDGQLAGKVSPLTGSSTQVTPVQTGSGKIMAKCSLTIPGCVDAETGTVGISSTPLASFSIEHVEPSVEGASVTAGAEIPLKICMRDSKGQLITQMVYKDGQPVTNPNNDDVLINFTSPVTATFERTGIDFSTASLTNYASASFSTTAKSLDFNNGCSNIFAKVYKADNYGATTALLNINYPDPNQPGVIVNGSGLKLTKVDPKTAHHFVTTATGLSVNPEMNSVPAWASPGTTDVLANNSGNRFNVTTRVRDEFGNPAPVAADTDVNLVIVKSDGTTEAGRPLICSATGSPANGTGCLNPTILSGQNSVTVNNLALDIGGHYFYVKANGSLPFYASSFSTKINATTSRKTVKEYVITAPTTATAGVNTPITVKAVDNAGQPIIGADADLNAMTFEWIDGAATPATLLSHVAPNSAVPVLGELGGTGTGKFQQGTATVQHSFTLKETALKINVRDSQDSAIRSNNTTETNVSAGQTLTYQITCLKETNGAILNGGDCTGASLANAASIAASPNDRFSLVIKPFDQYKNPRAGGATELLQVDLLDGSAGGLIKGFLEQAPVINSTSSPNRDIYVDVSNELGTTVTGLFHRAGNHKISYSINGKTSDSWGKIYHNFTPSIDMVYKYDISVIPTHTAGQQQSFTITAKDRAGNIAKGIDGGLRAQQFTWLGASASVAPKASFPLAPADSNVTAAEQISFNDGQSASLNVTFRKAETVSLVVQDSYTPVTISSVTIGGEGTSSRRKSDTQSVTVNSATATSLQLTAASTTSPQAGVGFGVVVRARDTHGNVASTHAESLNFAWSNASNSILNPKNENTTFTPSANGGLQGSMTLGSFTSANTFLLYRAGETPRLTVTGATSGFTTFLDFTPVYNSSHGYVLVTTNNAYLSTQQITGPNDMTTDSPRFVFAHLFDAFGNPMPKSESVKWEGTGQLLNRLTEFGNSTTLSPTAEGNGTVIARCDGTGLTPGCVAFTSGNFTIRPGNINKLVWQPVTPSAISQNTEACTEFRIQAQDGSNTPVNVTQATPVTFTSTNGDGEFFATIDECNSAQAAGDVASLNTTNFHNKNTGLVSGGAAGVRTKNILVTENAVSVWYANRTPHADAQVYADILGQYKSSTIRGAITVGPTKRVAVTSSAFEITAGGCGSISYKFQDKWANDRALATGATINLRSTATGSSGAFHSNSGCTAAILGGIRELNAGATADTVWYTDTQANNATPRILGTSDASGGTASTVDGNSVIQAQSVAATVRSGTFNVTTTSGKSKYPFTINWGNSLGARDYTVTYGTDGTCGSAIPAGVTVDSANRSATFNSGLLTTGSAADNTYFICLRANGYTGSAGSGTPSRDAGTNSYFNMVVDNAVPTGTITAPSATSNIVIGPAMAEMGSGTDTIFRGTAADARAGVQNVEVRLQQGSNFWNGTDWSATTEQWLPVITSDSFANWTYTISDANMNLRNDNASHILTVRITDQAGNVSTATTKTFTWKNSSSTATLSGVPGNLVGADYYWNGSNLNVGVSATSMAYYRYSIVSFGSTCTPSTEKTSGNITDPVGTDGRYVLCVLAYDVAGNAPTTATTHTFYRDTSAPSFTGVNTTVNVRTDYTPAITATDTNAPTGSSMAYSWKYKTVSNNCMVNSTRTAGAVVGSILNPTFTVTECNNFTNGQWGSPVLTLTATDSAGNSTTTSDITLNWDAETPYVSTITTTATGHKKAGDTVDITVPFVKTTTAPGNPNASSFSLTVSGVDMENNATKPTLSLNVSGRTAIYTGVSGKNLTFRYTVQAGDNVPTLVNGTTITLPANVTIQDALGNNIKITVLPNTAWASAVTIDTTAPGLQFSSGTLPNSNGSKKTTSLGITIADADTATYQFDIVSAGASYPITGSAPTGTALQTICETGSYGSTWTAKATALTKDISNDTTFPQDKWVVICARGRDLALNEQPTTSYTAYAWIKDTIAPAVPAITAPTSAQRFASIPSVTWQTPAADVNKIDLIVTRSGGTTCSGTVVERYISGTPDSRLAGNSTSQQLGGSGVVSGQSYTDGLYDVCLYTYDVAENKSTMSSTSFELETDTLHIGWTDSTGVRYQTRSGVGNWFGEPETPASGTFGARTSLAVDANGAPWLAYQYDNGTTSFLAYKQRNSGTWGSEVTLASSVSSGKTGLYADIALNNQGLLVSTSYGLKNSVQGMMVADSDGSTSVRDSTSAATPNGVRDTSVTIAGSDNKTYSVASMLNGSNLYELRILNRTAGSVTAIPFPTGCAEAPYASSFAYSDTQIGIAMACRMSSGACTVQYGLATFNTTNNTYSYSTWLNIGTIKASSCVLSDLTEGHRPSLAINRPTSDNGNSTVVGIVWTNSSKQIQYSETILAPIVSTSTPTATTVATGTGTTVGQQTLSFDKFGKAYIVYQDDNSIMFTNNNSGTFRTPALISTASSPPTVTGVGNIGITGMRGRGNTNGR